MPWRIGRELGPCRPAPGSPCGDGDRRPRPSHRPLPSPLLRHAGHLRDGRPPRTGPRMAILDLGGGGALNVSEQLTERSSATAPPGQSGPSTTTASRCLPTVPSTRSATDSSTPAPTSATSDGCGDTSWLFFRDSDGIELEKTPVPRWRSHGHRLGPLDQTPSRACTCSTDCSRDQSAWLPSGVPAVVVRHLIGASPTDPIDRVLFVCQAVLRAVARRGPADAPRPSRGAFLVAFRSGPGVGSQRGGV